MDMPHEKLDVTIT